MGAQRYCMLVRTIIDFCVKDKGGFGHAHTYYWKRNKSKVDLVTATSFPGTLFSAALSRWNRDPGCGWSRDHLSIQNCRVGGYSNTFGREDDKIPHPSCRFFYHSDSGDSREAEKRDPGNEVGFPLSRKFYVDYARAFDWLYVCK